MYSKEEEPTDLALALNLCCYLERAIYFQNQIKEKKKNNCKPCCEKPRNVSQGTLKYHICHTIHKLSPGFLNSSFWVSFLPKKHMILTI